MKKALLVIDANEKNLVVYIKNATKKNLFSKLVPFQAYEGTEEIQLVDSLHIVSRHEFIKYKGDAFSTPSLNALLKEHQIDCVEVTGIDGGGCVSLTAFGAIKEGYHVIVNEKAIGTMFQKKKEKYFKQLRQLGAEFYGL